MRLSDIDITDVDIDELCANEDWVFDSDRRDILKNLDSIDVQACPGSGKTTLIGAKLILLAKKWNSPHSGICVLSHTNVAKDEIIIRLKNSKSPESEKLLRYPHFIGTIQEFVTKHLGAPFLRSCGIVPNIIDDNFCVEYIGGSLSHGTLGYVKRKSDLCQHNVLYDFDLYLDSEKKIKSEIPTWRKKVSQSPSYTDLKKARKKSIEAGVMFYKDLYVFSEYAVHKQPKLCSILSTRFPLVFIDEMQDTQKFQDDLLQTIFQNDPKKSNIQRFGDPDQAIYDSFGDGEPNSTYNSKPKAEMFRVIDRSHRFNNDIANLIKGFSFNEVELESEDEKVKSETYFNNGIEKPKHTIFLFDEGKEEDAISAFAELLKSQFNLSYLNSDNFKAKALGGVGQVRKNADEQKKKKSIINYNKNYSLDKAPKKFKPANFIEAILFARSSTINNSSTEAGNSIIGDAVLRLLRLANVTCEDQKFHTMRSLKEFLNEKGKYSDFRKLVFDCLNSKIAPNNYKNTIVRFLALFDLTTESDAVDFKKFLEFEDVQDGNKSFALHNNIMDIDGVKIEFSTIHGAKGETHDATLVVTTFNYIDDLTCMIEYLLKSKPTLSVPNTKLSEGRTAKPNKKFMRQLYVAMSRPKHLLCLAMPKSADTETHVDKLKSIGWNIKEV